jgi:hypothetical protein
VVDFGDIGPFIAALSDPNGYAAAFPGLAGSMVFHAGCNCDGDMLSAQQLAAGMRANLPAARLPALRAFVTQVIAHHANHPVQRAYWQQVLTRLNQ